MTTVQTNLLDKLDALIERALAEPDDIDIRAYYSLQYSIGSFYKAFRHFNPSLLLRGYFEKSYADSPFPFAPIELENISAHLMRLEESDSPDSRLSFVFYTLSMAEVGGALGYAEFTHSHTAYNAMLTYDYLGEFFDDFHNALFTPAGIVENFDNNPIFDTYRSGFKDILESNPSSIQSTTRKHIDTLTASILQTLKDIHFTANDQLSYL